MWDRVFGSMGVGGGYWRNGVGVWIAPELFCQPSSSVTDLAPRYGTH